MEKVIYEYTCSHNPNYINKTSLSTLLNDDSGRHTFDLNT